MPEKLALFVHLERLWPPYDKENLYFSLNLSAAFDNEDPGAGLNLADLRERLLPWNWAGIQGIVAGFRLEVPDGTGGTKVEFKKVAAEFVPFGDPKTEPRLTSIKLDPLKELTDYRLQQLRALDAPDGSPFRWDAKLRDEGARAEASFHHFLMDLAIRPAPVPHLADLALIFRVKASSIDDLKKKGLNEGARFFAAPDFNKLPDGPGGRLRLKAEPDLAVPTDGMDRWHYEAEGGSTTPAEKKRDYCAYLNAWVYTGTKPETKAEGIIERETHLLRPPKSDEGDWATGMEGPIGEIFDLSQRLIDAARSQQGALEALELTEFPTAVYGHLRAAVVGCARDTANTGVRPGPNGDTLADAMLRLCVQNAQNQVLIAGEQVREAVQLGEALRSALVAYERVVVSEGWRKLLSSELPELGALPALSGETRPQRTRSGYRAELDELEQVTAALAGEENLRKVVLAQWAAAATSSVKLPRPDEAETSVADRAQHWFYANYPWSGERPRRGRIALQEAPEWSCSIAEIARTTKEVGDRSFEIEWFGIVPGGKDPVSFLKVKVVETSAEITLELPAGSKRVFHPTGRYWVDLALRKKVETGEWLIHARYPGDDGKPAQSEEFALADAKVGRKAFVRVRLTSGTALEFSAPTLMEGVSKLPSHAPVNGAATFWRRFSALLPACAEQLGAFRRRLTVGNVGEFWNDLLPSHGSDTGATAQVRSNLEKQLGRLYAARVQSDNSIGNVGPRWPRISPAEKEVAKLLGPAVVEQGQGLTATLVVPVPDPEAPTERAHPVLLQADRFTRAVSVEGTGSDAEDREDLTRVFSGFCTFLRMQRPTKTSKVRSLNMAQILVAVPRRMTGFSEDEARKLDPSQLESRLKELVPADETKRIKYLTEDPAADDKLFELSLWEKPIRTGAVHADTAGLLRRALNSPEDRRIARAWLFQDLEDLKKLIAFTPAEKVVHPQAMVGSRLGYQSGLRQATIAYDNQPLVAQSPLEELVAREVSEQDAGTGARREGALLRYRPIEKPGSDEGLAAWGKPPALVHGRDYSAWLVAVSNAGALPVNFCELDKDGKVLHPARIALRSNVDFDKLESYRRAFQYLRRRRVGAPARCLSDRTPLKNEQTPDSQALPPVTGVWPLAREFPTEVLPERQQVARYYFDPTKREGTLQLPGPKATVPWSVTLADLFNLENAAGSALTLHLRQTLNPKEPATLSLSVTRDGTNLKLVLRVPDAEPAAREVTVPLLRWPRFLDLRVSLIPERTETPKHYIAQVSYQADGDGWQTDAWQKGEPLRLLFDKMPGKPSFLELALDKPGATSCPVFARPLGAIAGEPIPLPERQDPLVILPHPSLPNHDLYQFHVSPPTVDIFTWDRWRGRDEDDAATEAVRKPIRELRVKAMTAFLSGAGQHSPHDKPALLATETRVERGFDDPACMKGPAGTAVPVLVAELVQLFPTPGLVGLLEEVEFPKGATGSPAGFGHSAPLRVDCRRDPKLAEISAKDGVLTAKVPEGSICELRLYPAVETRFVDKPEEQRFPKSVGEGRRAVKGRYLLTPLVTVIEAASSALPEADALWEGLRFDLTGSRLTVRLDRDTVNQQDAVGQKILPLDLVKNVELRRQVWRWAGRPLTPFPALASSDADFLPARRPEPLKPPDFPLLWDAEGFATREDNDHTRVPRAIRRADPQPLLFEEDLSTDRRARYLRCGLVVHSRYEGLGSALFTRSRSQIGAGRRIGEGSKKEPNDLWRRFYLPCRWSTASPVERPRLKFIVPLTQADPERRTSDLLVVLREGWYDCGGLAEFLEADLARVKPAFGGPPIPEYGPDPILTGRRRIGFPQQMLVENPSGHTFDTDTEEPLFVASSFVLQAPRVELLTRGTLATEFGLQVDLNTLGVELLFPGVEVDGPPKLGYRWKATLRGQTKDGKPTELLLQVDRERPGGPLLGIQVSDSGRHQMHVPGLYALRVRLQRTASSDAWTASVMVQSGAEWRHVEDLGWSATEKFDLKIEPVDAKGTLPTMLPPQATEINTGWDFARLRLRRRLDVLDERQLLIGRSHAGKTLSYHLPLEPQTAQCEITAPVDAALLTDGVTLQLDTGVPEGGRFGLRVYRKEGKPFVRLDDHQPVPLPVHPFSRVDVRLVLERVPNTRLSPDDTWSASALYRVAGERWKRLDDTVPFRATNTPATLTLADVPADFPELRATRVAIPLYSEYTEPQWVQCLPNSARVEAMDGTVVNLEAVRLFKASKENDCFKLVLGDSTDGAPLRLDLLPRLPETGSAGASYFSPYLVVTRLISDVAGRTNQEIPVGLYRMNAAGIAHPLDDVRDGRIATGPVQDGDIARLTEWHRRLDQLPIDLPRKRESLEEPPEPEGEPLAKTIAYRRIKFSHNNRWDIWVGALRPEGVATGGAIQFDLGILFAERDPGESDVPELTLRATFDGAGKAVLSALQQSTVIKTTAPISPPDDGIDLRIRLRQPEPGAKWIASFQCWLPAADPTQDAWHEFATKVLGFAVPPPVG